jgi:GAF domain-containing protein
MSGTDPGGRIDLALLERSLERLGERAQETALEEALQQLLDTARILFHATGTGLMVIDENAELRYVAATDEPGELLERTQEAVGQGPCVDALRFDTVIQAEDLAQDERWPELRPELPDAGVRGVLGVPVHLAGTAVASLNAYSDRPHRWEESEIRGLEAYAGLMQSVVESALQARQRGELADQLQRALDNRVMIERAIGFVMGRRDEDAVTAFNRLRAVARSQGRKVVSVAEEVLAGADLDEIAGR